MGCFPKLREKGCVYVDKTAYFHRLITAPDDNCFFLARPRRFGKSLMISTLQAIFEGRRELFEGLDISRTDWAWEKYPVLYFNFGFASAISAEDFAKTFPGEVKRAIVSAEMTYDIHEDASTNFGNAIDVLNERNNGHGVVILIDEYDDPVAQLLHKPDEAEAVRARLAAFYHQMKDRVGKIRFLMITGVSKFTKMSVFSALSNLVDLSFDEVSAAMLGYTEEELDRYFADRMSLHAQRLGLSYGAYRAELKRWFNGYRFGKFSTAKVYNPVSIGVNLKKMEPVMIPSWAETGKSSMLMNYLNRQEYLSVNTEEITGVEEREFDVTDIRRLKTIPMLYQTGYLTIREYNPMTRTYDLGIPNEEVRQDLATLTMEAMTDGNADWAPSLGAKCCATAGLSSSKASSHSSPACLTAPGSKTSKSFHTSGYC